MEGSTDQVDMKAEQALEEKIGNEDHVVQAGSFDAVSIPSMPSEIAESVGRNDTSSHDSIGEGDEDDGNNHDNEDDDQDDDDNLSSNLSHVDPDMVQQAVQAAIEDAIAMRRSDSILSTESNDKDDTSESMDLEDSIHKSSQDSNASANYMEAASFEAAMLGPGLHRVLPHGKWEAGYQESSSDIVQFARVSTQSSEEAEVSALQDSISLSFRRTSERYSFRSMSKISLDSMTVLETIVSTDGEERIDEEHQAEEKEVSLLKILQSCNITIPEIPVSNEYSYEIHLLHSTFKDFCFPPLTIDAVQAIYDKELNQTNSSVPLPMDVVIEKPEPGLVNLLSHHSLLQLSRPWSMSFLRILLRILTNETDAEYETSILSSCPWYDETFGAESVERSYPRAFSSVPLRNQSSFSDQSIHGTGYETKKSNQLYSIVRLRGRWKSAVKQVLQTLEIILNDTKYEYLQGPVTRLLGLLCIGGVSVKELRNILTLATETKASPFTQLLLIRALQTAAAGASRSFLGKADPTSFFSFTSGPGITRTINIEKSSWPFKNDFGMALWFRAECFREPSTLLRVTNETNDGTEVSLLPISTTESGAASASVLVVTILERGKPVECVKINACIVHERVWYHVAVRHTRSRLKGMFSLSSREQLSVMLDGKPMTTETLKFPSLQDSNCKSVTLTFGANFDGQTGALYVFNNNVSDATLKALYEISSEITHTQARRSMIEWDSRQGEIVRKSKVLDLSMRRDDMDDVVLCNRVESKQNHHFTAVVDLEEEDETLEAGPLSKNSFNSRLYIVWDPRRIVGSTALELHSGAHATLNPQNVRQWTIDGVQNVMGSLGGIQSVLPIMRCLLSGTIESAWMNEPTDLHALRQRCLLCATVPDILLLFASLVRDHYQNAREMLRCGAIDLLEQSLQSNKQLGSERRNAIPAPSVVASVGVFPSLSAYFVNALLELRSTSSHYVALETKVFSRLVFNLPLWLGGPCQGTAIFFDLLPYVCMVSRQYPQKIRDCVGTKGLVKVIIELIEVNDEENEVSTSLFDRNIRDLHELRSSPSTHERWHVCEILFAMLLQVMTVGSTVDEVALIVDTLSNYLETEWEASSQEVSMGISDAVTRTGARQNRYQFALRASLLILFLLESKPVPQDFVRNFANVCGSAQGGAAWVLCSMVNSYCDRIRAIGVRCFVAYMEVTGKHADQPIDLASQVPDIEKARSSENRSLQENTISLISNVGHGLLNSNVRKGLSSIGPSLRLKSPTISHLTPRVAYKLLWHLLKSHRYRIRGWTQGSLVAMVFERKLHSSLFALSSLKENCLIPDEIFQDSLTINWTWVESTMQDINIPLDPVIRSDLGVNTIIRLLRFLPDEYVDQWLSNLVRVSSRSTPVMEALSITQDWQPCIFQLASELTEKLVGSATNVNISELKKEEHHSAGNDAIFDRLNLALELYSMLLGNLFRHGEEKALGAIEDAASLQRVCLNGQRVFLLILTKLISNLSTFGVVSFHKMVGASLAPEQEATSTILLKRSAKLVTDTILLNASKGLTMPSAVDCWRCLRHLNAVVVAMITRLGFGVAELLDSKNITANGIDLATEGLFGIRLPDGEVGDVSGRQLATWYLAEIQGNQLGNDNTVEKRIDKRICVNIAAQTLALLDVFIFPDSLDVTHPSSQLHGLALVRNTESRIGHAQGPLLASLVRLSLLLLNQLEPCSVTLLQCSSRLRCFLHWILELVRESEALEGYSAAFNKLTAPFDRLILAIALQCRQTLKRSHSLFLQLESTTSELPFDSKDMRKKMYRRLMRVCVEMREILVTVMEQRNDVLRSCLSSDSFKALQKSLETNSGHKGDIANLPKEELVQKLLRSSWVISLEDGLLGQDPQQPDDSSRDVGSDGRLALTNLLKESLEISSSFDKSLNACFENYLESQRKWTETGAVRDLEYEGDTVLKRLSVRHTMDLVEFSKDISLKSQAADRRWRNINQKVLDVWRDYDHWKLPRYTDALGRRIVLVKNRCFSTHEESSYDLLMGKEREREEREREIRLQKKKELAELMKRNAEAFVPLAESSIPEDEEEKEHEDLEEQGGKTSGPLQDPTDQRNASTIEDSEVDNVSEEEVHPSAVVDGETMDDVDAWAKTFIWSESESVVARFDSVMIVTLLYIVEGKLLLTTHGLYFHQTGEEINTVTKNAFANGKTNLSSSVEHDRRWRLSRLKEVHGRRYMLRTQALELFFSDCEELFLNFPHGQKERNRFYAKLRNSCKVPMLFSPKSLNPRTIYKKSNLPELWRKRRISNFDYIMALNRMAGRTFNDIAQYPVFPWVLSDYTSEKIDLTDSRAYRDLTKPVGALNPDRLAQLLERFNELEQFGFAENERFLYGSHYSSPGVVLHFLIRQEPFTSMAIDLQSGRFDCPDRLFFDVAESWKSCNTSSSDVKELIPEFFTLPEILLNTNKFPLGKTQKGLLVDDVILPPWAKGSAHEFVRLHRLALESDYVSRNLNHWIDLIFGCKQRGPAAEAAHNIFHHLSYEGAVDLDKIIDDLDRHAAESHIQNFGQTPSQLLPKDLHPHRLSIEESWVPLINNMSSTVRLRCHTPGKQYGGKKGNCGSAIKISVSADTINVVYSELKFGTFRWYPKATKNRLKPDKLRSFSNRLVSNSRTVIKRGSAAPQTMDQNSSKYAVGNWSFAMTLGGYEKEQLRRKALMPSRLVSAKDALYTDSPMLVLSCGYWDNSIKVHSTGTWKLECVETGGHQGAVRCLNVSSDGAFMISGGEDCTCRVWVVDHPDVAVALSDGYIQTALGHRTDVDQILNCCRVLWGHEAPITCVDLCPDLDIVLSGSLEGKVCVHTLRRGDFIRSIRPHTKSEIGAVAVSKIALEKHGRFVVHTNDGMLHTFTINGVCLCKADAGEQIHDMVITGEVLVTGGDRCHVYIRDLVTLKILSGLDLNRHGPIRSISLTPAELNPIPQHLFIGSDDGMISIVDREDIRVSTGGR